MSQSNTRQPVSAPPAEAEAEDAALGVGNAGKVGVPSGPAAKFSNYMASFISYCAKQGIEHAVIAINEDLCPFDIARMLGDDRVAGLIVSPSGTPDELAAEPRLGRYLPEQYSWELPNIPVRVIGVMGPRSGITFRMARAALTRRATTLVYSDLTRWQSEYVLSFIARKFIEKGVYLYGRFVALMSSRARHYMTRLTHGLGVGPYGDQPETPVGYVRTSRPYVVVRERAGILLGALEGRRRQRAFRRTVEEARAPALTPGDFQPDNVLLFNSSLAWGGAERQIVSTLIGVKARGYPDVSLVCEFLRDRPDHDFYLWMLEDADIDVAVLDKSAIHGLNTLPEHSAARIEAALRDLPKALRDDVSHVALEIYARRPAVVHAWQDSTSIKVGLAAALVGVPKIVLASRNLAPYHFPYHQNYMAAGYRALSGMSNVVMLNNSAAGARDYADWLGLDVGRFEVLFNGVDTGIIARRDQHAVDGYKAAHRIALDAPVVGSVFRFYREKDPELWVRAMAEVAAAVPRAVFLLVGTGPLAGKISRLADELGIGQKLVMPGTETDPALPLSAMDVFVLTSRQEGTPNVIIEAQLLGVPVVATDAGGTCDTFVDGVTGWLVKSRDPALVAAPVLRVLEDRQWAADARREAALFARERFGLERMVDDTLRIYGLARRSGEALSEDV